MSPTDTPPSWVMTLMSEIRRDISAQHAQLRTEMADGFAALRAELQVQNGRVRAGEDRLTKIETAREIEDKVSMRRGSVAGAIAAVVVAFLLSIVKAWVEK